MRSLENFIKKNDDFFATIKNRLVRSWDLKFTYRIDPLSIPKELKTNLGTLLEENMKCLEYQHAAHRVSGLFTLGAFLCWDLYYSYYNDINRRVFTQLGMAVGLVTLLYSIESTFVSFYQRTLDNFRNSRPTEIEIYF